MSLRPIMDALMAKRLIKELYDMDAEDMEEFVSYDDRNFCFVDNNNECYVLKVTNWQDSLASEFFGAQNKLMNYLHKFGFRVPNAIKNNQGKDMSLENLDKYRETSTINNIGASSNPSDYHTEPKSEPSKALNVVRLLTFVPGQTLAKQCASSSPSSSTLVSVGRIVGKMDLALKNALNEEERQCVKNRFSPWFLKNCVTCCRPLLRAVKNESDRSMIEDVLNAFEENVRMEDLEQGIIHGDVNEQNLLINEENEMAIIDFGDVNFAPLIFDLAATTAYMMLIVEPSEALNKAANVIKGYNEIRALSDEEWKVLPICVAARFAQSLVLGADAFEKDPSNLYVLSSAKNGYEVLRNICRCGYNGLRDTWRQSCD